jgi:serine/threonine-protein kinase MRCK
MVAICDKERHIRLIPSRALEGDEVEWIKIEKTKGCTHFTTGALKPKDGSSEVTRCLCIAVKQKASFFYFHLEVEI